MAEYLSGQISFGGLTEDTDFATLLDQLKTIEMRKANQLARWKADWQARIDGFQSVRTALSTLQGQLRAMSSTDSFLVKSSVSSQAGVATATPGHGASTGVYSLEVNQLASTAFATLEITGADKSTKVTGATQGELIYSYGGTTRTVTIPPDTTLESLKNIINSDSQNLGVVAQLIAKPGGMFLQIRSKETGAGTLSASTSGWDSSLTMGPWDLQPGADAEIRCNGWPASGWLSSASNTLTDILDTGLTVNLYSIGSTTISVGVDTAAVRKNVQNFVDAVNAFRKTVVELTKVDDNKTVYEPEYAQSQNEMQKGAVLTGNYGVQMITSRLKSIISSQGLGFSNLHDNGGVMEGDIFASLSQIGIMTNADQGSEMYGLLEINTGFMPWVKTLDEALQEDPLAVASLFASNNEGKSFSSSLGHVSNIEGVTKPGTYTVNYDVAPGGTVTGTINGKAFQWYPSEHQIGVYSNTPPPNDADGLVLEIYDLTVGSHSNLTVAVRQGKVNELLSLMEGSQGILGSEGTLAVLENNYKNIIKNIDQKLMDEDERLIRWERTTKARFVRLETQIARYQQLNKDVKSQIAQLGQKSDS
ncbi:MAG: flagellar filament capping protein FliD [Desulfovibrio sp.]|jgi:flagellar hook-associated protein 2|nr:flagellar filament capping protein FliD [Desulfovibrio sp.]